MTESAFDLKVDQNNIATLCFNLPGEKVNTLDANLLQQLEKILDELCGRSDIKALVMCSGKADNFIAGADLHLFNPAFKNPELLEKLCRSGHRTFNKIAQLPFPAIAVIHGTCLGGGLELALACHYRVVTDHHKTVLGLPEVTLGVIPGWGGTQRLPRLIGLIEGLGFILSGKRVNGKKAYELHLADELVSAEFRNEKLAAFIDKILTEKGRSAVRKARRLGWRSILMEGNPIGRALVFKRAKQQLTEKTKGHYLAPEMALELVRNSFPLSLAKGLELEIETILSNTQHTAWQAINLIDLFFTQEALKKDVGMPIEVSPKSVVATAVLGAGTMGAGIAWLLADHSRTVRLKDLHWDAVGRGMEAVQKLFLQRLERKRITPSECHLKSLHVSPTIDYSGFRPVDIVFEAPIEDLEAKKRLFAELESYIHAETIIATNTSSLSISKLASDLKYPERFIGLHFFNPVHKMPLVEVIPGLHTSIEVIATAVQLCRDLGKVPIIVGDCAGFLVNRIFIAGANEAMWMFQEGIPMLHIERVCLDFGLPISPFLLADEVGNDVCYKVAQSLEAAYGERFACPEIVTLMSKNGLYGKKNGKGFYLYSSTGPLPNPEVLRLLAKLQSNLVEISDRDIKDRLLLAMVNEAARCLEEKVVCSANYLDMAMIMGTGFPPFRGGVLKYADTLGIDYVGAQLKKFYRAYGPRFETATLLEAMNKSGGRFYSSSDSLLSKDL